MKAQHTKTPWILDSNAGHTEQGNNCFVGNGFGNAAFIVKCVNNHDALVEALEMIVNVGSGEAVNIARKALTAAKGE